VNDPHVTGLRLTRRGRLMLQTFPVFLVLVMAVQVLANRGTGDAHQSLAAPPSAAGTTPAPARTTTAPASPTTRAPAPGTPSPSRTPSPSVRATPARTAFVPTGRLVVVPGTSAVHGSGTLRRFTVEVEAGLSDDPKAFAAAVERVLFDRRSWPGSFQRVESGPVSFRVVLATPRTTDRLCGPLDTGGIYSCYMNGRSVINAMRWRDGAASYAGDLASYRIYVVNHEVGHALGHGHRLSCAEGGYAPVMIQQTKSLYGCRRNPWPLASER
jgi:hypothetical protein